MVDVPPMPLPAPGLDPSRPGAARRSSAGRLRLVYFAYFAASGVSLPYLAAYLHGRGFAGEQIGSIQMLPSLLSPLVALGWARVADRLGDPVRVLRWITAWAACSALLLPFAATPLAVGLVVFSQSLGDRAVVPLLDATSLEHCRRHPGTSYARIRLFGSLGFLVLAFVLGRVLTLRGDLPGDPAVPATIAVLAAGYALAAQRLAPAPSAHPERPTWGDLAALLRDRRLLLLFAAGAIHWAACVPYSLWLGVFVQDLRLPARVAGAGIAAAVAAEIGVMLAYPRLRRRLPPRALLAVSFLGSALRWALLSRTTRPELVVALQLLHGLTYGLFWSTLVEVVSALVPPRMRATGLALNAAVVLGGGTALGANVAGRLYDHYRSVAPLFAWSAAADLAIAVAVLAILARLLLRPPAPTPPDGGP